jgi:Family of unknown function (DUF5677)
MDVSTLIITQGRLVNKIFEDNQATIEEGISKSKYPFAFKALLGFSKKIKELSDSVEDISSKNNFYSSQVMTRIVIEHFIVAYYIWTKSRIEKNDECAKEYYAYYGMQELIKQDTYNAKLDKTYNAKITQLQNFIQKDPEFSEMTEDDIKEINTKANKFDIKKIFAYLRDELNDNDSFKSIHLVILDFCKIYNRLSSYVHGGPTAELQTYENMPQTDYAKILNENIDNSRMAAFQIKSFIILLLINEDLKYMPIYQPIMNFIDGIYKEK